MDVESKVRPRRAWIAALLTLVLPGLGQLYGGRPKRALVVYLGGMMLITAFLISGVPRFFGGLVALVLVMLLFLLWALADAVRIARQSRDYVLKPFNRWYLYLAVWLVSSFLVAPKHTALSPVRAFRIPAGNMEPAVLVGDHVYADMNYYRSSKPVRGDIAVLSLPMAPARMLVGRVIGLEGEQIEIRDKLVFLNGQRLQDPRAHHSDPQVLSRDSGTLAVRDNFGPLKIPPRSVFLLGDNRDASLDSRYFGPIPLSSLQGRLLYVYWAVDRSRIGMDLR